MKTLKTNREYGFIVALLLVFAFMLTLNTMTPLFADDYFYSLNLRTEEPLTGFADVLHSISRFRHMHNGRIAAHFFAQLFLWLPKMLFNVVNAAMCTLLVYNVCRYVRGDRQQRSAWMPLSAFAFIWLMMPGFGHSMLWLSGSCSYLWAITFITLFVYPFYRRFNNPGQERKQNPGLELLALAYAFFAGAYSENGAFSALAITFCFLLLIYIIERKIPKTLLLRFLAACGGFLFLMLSPKELGNKNTDAYGVMFPVLAKAGIGGGALAVLAVIALLALAFLLWGIMRHRKRFCKVMAILSGAGTFTLTILLCIYESLGATSLLTAVNLAASDIKISLVLLAGIYFVLLMLALMHDCEVRKILSAIVLGLGAFLSVAVFLVASYFPARGVCVATVYITIADLLFLSVLYPMVKKKWLRLSAAALALLFGITAAAALADIKTVDSQFEERLEIVAQAKEQGLDSLELQPLTAQGKYCAAWQGEAADYYPAMEKYFGIKRVTIEGAIGFIHMD